ncbi:MAG TPA: SGNH/GDSL hydrolase family protein, partial [Candidatus Hydrogenedentes bacterium]|nr:SGNH/GDSL hydrolase family protein [Candidatus Hydrogenedentota bacterium]
KKHMERRDRINALGITGDFRINNYGFRDADIIVPKPAGTYRILCVGASTTEEGPVNDLTYPAILETLLNKHFGFNRIDVVNCGLSGMNSLKHRMRVGDYLALDPDLIVLYNAVNDICHDLYPIWVKDASPLQKRLRESVFLRRYFGQILLPDRSRMRADIEHSKISNLEFFIRYFRKHQVDVAVCSFAAPSPDALSRVERDYYEYYTVLEWTGRYSNFECYLTALRLYNEALHGLCEKENVLYIPVEENMRDGVVMFGDICHLRNPGIEKKAGIIADALIPRIEKAARL